MEFFVQKKKIIIEIAILIAFLGALYFVYQKLTAASEDATTVTANEQILGANFILFLQNQDSLSFNTSVLNNKLIKDLVDHSQTIASTTSRGRADPFTPYVTTGSLR